ncbi:MAG TPA: hypothetical protein VFO85_05240, partial [Vicinamibacteria bacterium]|nr:hypothetical protein [Vicinamibacteria bacterium]
DRDGRFVVAWASQSTSTPGGFQVVARRFDQAGAPRGSDFAVTSPAFVQHAPDAAIDETGRLAIVWASDTSIRGRLWDAEGTPLGLEFVVSSTPAQVGSPDVAFAPQGGFVVVWLAGVAPGPERDVFAQRFDATGTRLGLEFRVNAVTSGFEDEPTVAFQDSGSFVVAWSSLFLPLGQRIVYQRLFTASGNPLTSDVLVDTIDDCCPRLAPGANGDLLTTWTTGATDFDVAARRFDAAGTPLETAFVVPQFTGGFQAAPDVVGSGGAYVLAWESDTLTGSQDVFARLLGWLPSALAVDPSPLQSNGNGVLEAGETVIAAPAWTNADRAAAALTGLATSFTGPGVAPVYSIADSAANYGTLPVGVKADCLAATANCY